MPLPGIDQAQDLLHLGILNQFHQPGLPGPGIGDYHEPKLDTVCRFKAVGWLLDSKILYGQAINPPHVMTCSLEKGF